MYDFAVEDCLYHSTCNKKPFNRHFGKHRESEDFSPHKFLNRSHQGLQRPSMSRSSFAHIKARQHANCVLFSLLEVKNRPLFSMTFGLL